VDRSHRIILTLPQRHAGFDITLSHGKVEENAHRAADLRGFGDLGAFPLRRPEQDNLDHRHRHMGVCGRERPGPSGRQIPNFSDAAVDLNRSRLNVARCPDYAASLTSTTGRLR